MAQSLKQVSTHGTKLKTVNVLLATYFSVLTAMIGFSGFFIYTHITTGASASAIQENKTEVSTSESKKTEPESFVSPLKATR